MADTHTYTYVRTDKSPLDTTLVMTFDHELSHEEELAPMVDGWLLDSKAVAPMNWSYADLKLFWEAHGLTPYPNSSLAEAAAQVISEFDQHGEALQLGYAATSAIEKLRAALPQAGKGE
jgi:hypothetical protein